MITNASETISTNQYKQRLTGLDKSIEKILNDFNIPGMAVSIIVNGEVIKEQGYGYRNIEKQLKVTSDTQFSIASLTKSFTSFTIGTLVDEGKLDWDIPVKSYLPKWQLQNSYATNHVNLRDMLSHRVGLPRHDLLMIKFPKLTGEELLKKLKHLDPSKELRQRFQYNNLMYGMAGYTAEKVTGKAWSKLLNERILDKVDMVNTSVNTDELFLFNDIATPYDEIGHHLTPVPYSHHLNSVIAPAGSLYSSISDLNKWAIMILNNGKYKDKVIIKPGTLKQLQLPQIPVSTRHSKNKKYSPDSYGLGWHIRNVGDHYLVYHSGNSNGFTSMMFTYPKENIAVTILVNKDMSDIPYGLAFDISERLFGNHSPKNVANLLADKRAGINHHANHGAQHKAKPEPFVSSTFSIEKYTGIYKHPAYGEAVVSQKNDKLYLRYGSIYEPFEHWNYNSFIGTGDTDISRLDDERILFNINDEGKVESVLLPFESRLSGIRFNRVF
jgi:CubicO group peptidase (beta-lactamase class C family)